MNQPVKPPNLPEGKDPENAPAAVPAEMEDHEPKGRPTSDRHKTETSST